MDIVTSHKEVIKTLHSAKSWMCLLKIFNPKTNGSILHLQLTNSIAWTCPLIINQLHKEEKFEKLHLSQKDHCDQFHHHGIQLSILLSNPIPLHMQM